MDGFFEDFMDAIDLLEELFFSEELDFIFIFFIWVVGKLLEVPSEKAEFPIADVGGIDHISNSIKLIQ